MHIYFNITIYLPHFSYMFRRVIYHLQGGKLVFLFKTTFSKGCYLFDVQGSGHRKCIPKYDQQDATLHSFFLFL